MKVAPVRSASVRSISTLGNLLAVLPLVGAAVATGCGDHGTTPVTPPAAGNTSVTFLLSATANDRLVQYQLNLQDLTLTSKSGNTVSVLATAQNAAGAYTPEFMHLNGNAATLLTASVPEDTYTSATLTAGGASFSCIAINPQDGSLTTSTFAYGATPQSQVMVNLPAPIAVSGSAMSLSMELQGSQSYTLGECPGGSLSDTYTITPTFNLSVADLSSAPTNYLNGRETDVLGEVTTATSSGFNVALGYSEGGSATLPTQSIATNASTAFYGINGVASLKPGTFVDMDLVAQADGSLAAARVAVRDTAAVDVVAGPLAETSNAYPALLLYGQQVEGADQLGNSMYYDVSKATFQIPEGYSNLSTLPFTPSFEASNLVVGQNVYLTTPSYTNTGFNRYPLANTVTLMPQTIDGIVTAVESSGDFNVYTVTLASYALFADLAGQPGGSNLIQEPQQVTVYVDGHASLVNGTPALGATYRFHGLVFNDNGVLRMDSDQVAAGVAQ